MLKKLTRKKDEAVEERKAKFIIPPVLMDCFIGCAIRCDHTLPPEDQANPTGWVCYEIT